MTLRPYRAEDLDRVRQTLGEWNKATDFCGYLHPGDVVHVLSNAHRGNFEEQLYLSESDDGELLGMVLFYPPRFTGYDLLVHPAHRGGALEADLVDFATRTLWPRLQAAKPNAETIVGMDVMDCDHLRQEIMRAAGYVPDGEPYMAYTTRSLSDPIPDPPLPEGYFIRSTTFDDVEQLCAVHSGSFHSSWTPEEYLRVMNTPGFDPARERVVVAPDGRFAAFTIYWPDPVSKSFLFEPVGTHDNFQRKGLSRALMYHVMHLLKAEGYETAIVKHEMDNPASTALYAAVGFTLRYAMFDWRKKMA